jgi:hypothetical protein
MRVPFFPNENPEPLKGVASRATVVPTHERALPRLRPRTLADALAARDRHRRHRANGGQPS